MSPRRARAALPQEAGELRSVLQTPPQEMRLPQRLVRTHGDGGATVQGRQDPGPGPPCRAAEGW